MRVSFSFSPIPSELSLSSYWLGYNQDNEIASNSVLTKNCNKSIGNSTSGNSTDVGNLTNNEVTTGDSAKTDLTSINITKITHFGNAMMKTPEERRRLNFDSNFGSHSNDCANLVNSSYSKLDSTSSSVTTNTTIKCDKQLEKNPTKYMHKLQKHENCIELETERSAESAASFQRSPPDTKPLFQKNLFFSNNSNNIMNQLPDKKLETANPLPTFKKFKIKNQIYRLRHRGNRNKEINVNWPG